MGSHKRQKPLTVYLDTNCIIDMLRLRCGVTASMVHFFRKLVKDRRVSVLFSIFHIEEILALMHRDPERAREGLQFVWDVADRTRFIKPPNQLITEAVQSFERSVPCPSLFVENEDIWNNIAPYLVADLERDLGLLAPLGDTSQQIGRFRANLNAMVADFRLHCAEMLHCDPRSEPLPFADSWFAIAGKFARDIASNAGISRDLSDDDIKRLLTVPVVHMAAGDLASRIYGGFFMGHSAREGDSRDNLHAISAVASDILITRDKRFSDNLKRITHLPFVVMDLNELLVICQAPNGAFRKIVTKCQKK